MNCSDSPDIHTYFGLTYSNYLVLHRTLLQSMPLDWQHRFTACLGELNDAFEHVEQAPGYDVKPVDWIYAEELTDEQAEQAGIEVGVVEDGGPRRSVFYLNGNEVEGIERVPIPVREPIPHYNRGRTYLEPHVPGGAS